MVFVVGKEEESSEAQRRREDGCVVVVVALETEPVRLHVAVHRVLSAGMLTLLAMKYNPQIAPRGLHEGLSPLQRTGSTSSNMDWL
jgi:hypothetical protein